MTTTFKEFLISNQLLESYLNLFDNDEETVNLKKKYAKDVFDILQKSYQPIGGISGSGFSSPEDMIKNIPFWKLYMRTSGNVTKPIACLMYKGTSQNRKLVAGGSDGGEGKSWLKEKLLKDEVRTNILSGRSYGEVSGAILHIMKKLLKQNDWKEENFFVPVEKVATILKKDIIPIPGEKFLYKREIGGKYHEKMMYANTDFVSTIINNIK